MRIVFVCEPEFTHTRPFIPIAISKLTQVKEGSAFQREEREREIKKAEREREREKYGIFCPRHVKIGLLGASKLYRN
jgi:hypothetical protein